MQSISFQVFNWLTYFLILIYLAFEKFYTFSENTKPGLPLTHATLLEKVDASMK